MRLDVTEVRVVVEGTTIVDGVDLAVEPGEFVGLVGPNGSGKSTLLRTVYRAIRPTSGTVSVGERDVWQLSAKEAARRTAAVIQETPGEFDLTVLEVVAVGRHAHQGVLGRRSAGDETICRDALLRVGMADRADRDFGTLSGGEKQRVLLARAVAQQAQVLVLDEPTNHLDIRFQLELLDLVSSLELTTVAALHDLDLAARHCHRVFVLQHGRVVAGGAPNTVLTEQLVADVFGVRLHRSVDAVSGRTRLGFDRLDLTPPPHAAGDATARPWTDDVRIGDRP